MTGTQQILILHVCYSDENESRGIVAEIFLPQVCYMDKGKLESVIINESSMEEREPESVHKSINIKKNVIDVIEDEGPLVTDNTVINRPIYCNLFKCGKNILNRLDATHKRACMAISRDIYCTEMLKTLTDHND